MVSVLPLSSAGYHIEKYYSKSSLNNDVMRLITDIIYNAKKVVLFD